jgi:hypothetical protein
MSTQRLLNIAERLCGAAARRKVFEPLIADWHREWLDAGGHGRARAALILFRGYLAFGWTLAACVNPLRDDAPPMSRFTAGFAGFALLGCAIALVPMTFQWRHWWEVDIQVHGWLPKFASLWVGDLLYSVPNRVVYALPFAALPAAMLGAVGGAPAKRILAGLSFSILFAVAVHVAIEPELNYAAGLRLWRHAGAPPTVVEERVRYSEAVHIARITNNRPTPLRILWGRTRELERNVTAAIGLTLLGLALGRARRFAGRPVTVRAAALWWAFGWVSFMLLTYWANFMRPTIPWPRGALAWFPVAVLLIVSCVVLRVVSVRSREDDPATT